MKIDAGDGQLMGADGSVELRGRKSRAKAEAYAASLVELAKTEASLEVVDQDLRLVKETLAGHMGLKTTLADPDLPVERKQSVLEEIFGPNVSMVTLNFMQFLAGMGQIELLPEVAANFARRLEAEENKIIAEVTTAVPLEAEFAARLSGRLRDLAGKEVTLRSRVDADLIGGIVVRIGGKLLDGSIRHQLERLRDQMLVDMRGR